MACLCPFCLTVIWAVLLLVCKPLCRRMLSTLLGAGLAAGLLGPMATLLTF